MEKHALVVNENTSMGDICDMIEKLKAKRDSISEAILALQRIQATRRSSQQPAKKPAHVAEVQG